MAESVYLSYSTRHAKICGSSFYTTEEQIHELFAK